MHDDDLAPRRAKVMAWLDSHVNREAADADRFGEPNLERIRALVGLMGDPQNACPVVLITGTNGKGSTARILTALFMAQGLSVGTYASPHLGAVNERISYDGEPIDDEELVEILEAIRDLTDMLEDRPTWFEILTAAAYRWFADRAVSAAVVEVGMGGRWDATNVADAQVAVVTNVELDHVEVLGPTRADIAREKAGIISASSMLVLGEVDPDLAVIFRAAEPSGSIERGRDFGCSAAHVAHGGRLVDIFTPQASYEGIFLPLHGRHQGDNAACAIAAAEAFFGRAIAQDVVEEALAGVTVPGRMEIVGRRPLCILDGAHNVAGFAAAVASLAEDFSLGVAGRERRVVAVVGMLTGRDPDAILAGFGEDLVAGVVACTPDSPRAMPAAAVAAAARRRGLTATVVEDPSEAVAHAVAQAGVDGAVFVSGSLYVVAQARESLLARSLG
ncbi:MAG: Mur ligase family protein [Actinomycetota bacterium]|nr:Mur ligase family protein [Actinomycetota bacterium]